MGIKENFDSICHFILNDGPLVALVVGLIENGVTEPQLVRWLEETKPALPDPFKVSVHNMYRDIDKNGVPADTLQWLQEG